jgi:hypothetical protein
VTGNGLVHHLFTNSLCFSLTRIGILLLTDLAQKTLKPQPPLGTMYSGVPTPKHSGHGQSVVIRLTAKLLLFEVQQFI